MVSATGFGCGTTTQIPGKEMKELRAEISGLAYEASSACGVGKERGGGGWRGVEGVEGGE